MGKNIGKSAVWFALYWVASIIGVVAVALGYVVLNFDKFANGLDGIDFESIVGQLSVPMIGAGAIIVIAAFLIYKKVRKHPFDVKTIKASPLAFAVGAGFFLNCSISLLVGLLATLLPKELYDALNQSTGTVLETSGFWVTLLFTGILVPIMEEIIFRYGIFGTLARSNVVVAYIVSTVIFGLMHGNPIQICYTAVMGFVMAFLYHKGKNLWYPIALHVAVNSSSTVMTHFPEQGSLILIGIGIVGLILMILMVLCSKNVRALFKKEKPQVVIAE